MNTVDSTGRERIIVKPSGWKGKKTDAWWTKDSQYGLRYMCPKCGHKNLGIVWGDAQKRMHWKWCPVLQDENW